MVGNLASFPPAHHQALHIQLHIQDWFTNRDDPPMQLISGTETDISRMHNVEYIRGSIR